MASVTIVGAGLVGSLMACYLGRRGYEVDLYEAREDLREAKEFRGRSVNLAISVRGLSALSKLNLDDEIKEHCVPMKARMIHNVDGSRKAIPYGKQDQHINSISRNHLNKLLLNIAQQFPNVRLHFNQKLKSIDFKSNECTFVSTSHTNEQTLKDLEFSKLNFELYAKGNSESTCNGRATIPNGTPNGVDGSTVSSDPNESVSSDKTPSTADRTLRKADVIIGADGAFSKVRNQVIRHSKLNYEQMYIDHGYIELFIPPKKKFNSRTREVSYDFAMEVNYLHIWPRGDFMMIALPNQEKTYTVTLFMPFKNFEQITDQWKLLEFFKTHFPDSIDLIGRDELINTFFNNKPNSLVTVKCSPYNPLGGKCLLIGDAAHAMVPFYGQGMNCGFEDCETLDSIIEKHSDEGRLADFEQVFDEFSRSRNENCKVICNLALYNYIEMRHLVNTWSFLARKQLDRCLNLLLGDRWMPLYSMVTFSQLPYRTCLERKQVQDCRIQQALSLVKLCCTLALAGLAYRRFKRS